jgi:uncharacterized lipoprotein YddW (UPF0748 family)
MKKFALILSVLTAVTIFASCEKIEISQADATVSQADTASVSIQTESPPETTTTPLTTTTTAQTTVSTEEATTSATTANTTTAAPVTTTTPATTTTAPPTTTTTPATTTTVTTTTTAATTPPVISNTYSPLNYDEQIGVWVAYLDVDGWLKNSTEAQFKSRVAAAFDNIKNLGANTVYVHVRAFSDAYYPSSYYTWTNCSNGPGSSPGFDPLQIMIDYAHSRGLSFHAWLNPMRVMTESNLFSMSDSYTVKKWYNDSSKKGKYIVKPSNSAQYWLNPAYSEVRQLIYDGVREIVQNYDVDAIHIDDYFYPTTASSFDSAAFSASGSSDLSAWRFSNIDTLVSGIYSTIKSVNSKVEFGVSPQGNMNNNYVHMYADVKKWCSTSGYLDYITPQIYFSFDNKLQPYKTCSQSWNDIVKLSSIKLVFGLAPYRIGETTSPSDPGWAASTRIIAGEIEYSRTLSNYSGVALYRYGCMFSPPSSVASKVNAEMDEIQELLN